MPTILNNRSTLLTDPIRNFRFLVTFSPQSTTGSTAVTQLSNITFGFTSVSGLATTTDSIPYREGGYNTTVHQIPGQTSFAPITLSRGMIIGTNQNWNWMKMLFQTVQSSTVRTTADNFRCDVEIQVLAHPIASGVVVPVGSGSQDDFVVQRFKVYNAWISSIAYSDLNAGDNAIFVEQISMVHEGFEMTVAANLTTAAAEIN
jgi:phage tail-like protein